MRSFFAVFGLFAILSFVLADDPCVFKKGDYLSPSAALACLRALPIPDAKAYQGLCESAIAALQGYAFLDEFEHGGEFPETAVPNLLEAAKTACATAASRDNTFDYHLDLVTFFTTVIRDPHTKWVPTPAYSSVFKFLGPAVIDIREEDSEVAISIEESQASQLPGYTEAYESVFGKHSYGLLHPYFGKPISSMIAGDDMVEPDQWFRDQAEKFGVARTRGQRYALALSGFGELSLMSTLSPRDYAMVNLEAPVFDPKIVLCYEGGYEPVCNPVQYLAVAQRDMNGVDDLLALETGANNKEATRPAHVSHVAFPAEPLHALSDDGDVSGPTGAKTDSAAPAKLISGGEYVRLYYHADTTTAIVQINTYMPMNDVVGDAENQWLREFDAAVSAVRANNYDVAPNHLVLDERLNGGGYCDLSSLTSDVFSGGRGSERNGDRIRANYPHTFGRAFLRAGRVPEATAATRPADGLDAPRDRVPSRIYDDRMPMLKQWAGVDVHDAVVAGDFQGDRTFTPDYTPNASYTQSFFYPTLGLYNAHYATITGDKPENYIRSEFPEEAWKLLMEVGGRDYGLRNTIDNTVVLIGPKSASSSAFVATNLAQGSHAKVVASIGSPAYELGGQDMMGLVPGGDTVSFRDNLAPYYPAHAKAIYGTDGKLVADIDFTFTNFGIGPAAPDAFDRHGSNSREFQKEPVHAYFLHSNPSGANGATNAEHIWGSPEDAGVAALKLSQTGVWERCAFNTFAYDHAATVASKADMLGRRCTTNGKYASAVERMGCKQGFEYNYAGACVPVTCPPGQHFSTELDFCVYSAPHQLSTLEIVFIALGATLVVAIATLIVLIFIKRARRQDELSRRLLVEDEDAAE